MLLLVLVLGLVIGAVSFLSYLVMCHLPPFLGVLVGICNFFLMMYLSRLVLLHLFNIEGEDIMRAVIHACVVATIAAMTLAYL